MKAAIGDDMAVKAHVPMAKAAGATKEEVVDAILMTLTVSGIRGVVTCPAGCGEAVRKIRTLVFAGLSICRSPGGMRCG